MLKALILVLSLVGVSTAMASLMQPQLYSFDCRADNGVTIKTVQNPRAVGDRVLIESRLGLQKKLFSAHLTVREDGASEIALRHEGAALYGIVAKVDLSISETQIVDGLLYAVSLVPTMPRPITRIRCELQLSSSRPNSAVVFF